jgi:hypothetical protein
VINRTRTSNPCLLELTLQWHNLRVKDGSIREINQTLKDCVHCPYGSQLINKNLAMCHHWSTDQNLKTLAIAYLSASRYRTLKLQQMERNQDQMWRHSGLSGRPVFMAEVGNKVVIIVHHRVD